MTNVMTSLDVFLPIHGIAMLQIGTAMITSFKATVENRPAMLLWGGFVAAAVILAMLPLFLGMVLVFPMLGHSAWHLYRKAIEPAD